MKRFIPVTDRLVDLDRSGKLVPYQVGLPCLHWEVIIDRGRAESLLGEKSRSGKRLRRSAPATGIRS